MPFEVQFDADLGIVRINLSGIVNTSELVEAAIESREHGEGPQLWDAQRVAEADVDPSILDSLRELGTIRQEHGLALNGKRAVVTRNRDVRWMVEVISDEIERLGVEIRIFGDVASAVEWLTESQV